jgi:hypothetical protein
MGEQPGTRTRTAHVAASLFLLTAAYVLARTGRDALYVQGRGLHDLPFAYMAIALCSVPMAFGMLSLMRRLGPRRARLVSPVLLAGILSLYAAAARPGGGVVMTGFFVVVPLGFGVLFSAAWLLTADLLAGSPSRVLARAYSAVGAASIVGGMGGAIVARVLAGRAGPQGLLWLAVLVVLGSLAVMARAQTRFPAVSRRARRLETESGTWSVFQERYPVLLLLAAMAASLVGTLFEFQFYLAAASAGGSPREQVVLFANLNLLLNGAALVVQLAVMPRLQAAIGVHGSLQILPGVLLAGASVLAGGGSLFGRSLLRVAEGGLRASIHRVSWEQAFLPVDPGQRGTAKLLVDGVGARIAEGLGALILLVWLQVVVAGGSLAGRDTSWIAWLLAVVIAAWIALTHRLGHTLAAATVDPEEAGLRVRAPDS